MGFFDDIIGSVKGFAGDVFNTVKGVGGSVFDSVKGVAGSVWDKVKPIGSKILGVAGKAEETAERVVEKIADKADRLTDNGIQAVGNVGNLLGNPVFMIGALVVGGIVLTKVL